MKGKTQKGITLIALIITIVVLLILAAVAVTSITKYNIIYNANAAADKYDEEVDKENKILGKYNSIIGSYLNGIPVQDDPEEENTGSGSGSGENTGSGGSEGEKEEETGNPGDDKSVQITIGSYVEYDVSYTDMYQGTSYTSTNAWRYLGTDKSGNKLLVSTAIPVIVYAHNTTSGGKAKWWDTTQTDTNDKIVQGMLKNFDKIPYAKKTAGTAMTSGEENTAIGAFAPSKRTYNGSEYNAIGDYFKSSTYADKIQKVSVLTLEELNRAVNGVNGNTPRAETSVEEGFKDLTGTAKGLFDMHDLSGYSANYMYWLATSHVTYTDTIYAVHYKTTFPKVNNGKDYYDGVRPVIVLSSDAELVYNTTDQIFKIR